MQILLSTIFKYPHEGGLSTHISTLKAGLEELGHEVDVVSGSDFRGILDFLTIKAPSRLLNQLSLGKGQWFGDRRRSSLLFKKLKLVHENYDVINTQDIFATLASRQLKTKTVQTIHGYYTFEAISRGAVDDGSSYAHKFKRSERYAYKTADELVCVDQRLKQYVKHESGREAFTIPNFINTHLFNVSNDQVNSIANKHDIPIHKNLLLVPRRLTEKNGVIYPIKALKHVIQTNPNVCLIYAGSGEMTEELKSLVKEENLGNYVKFLGSVPHEDMIALYKLSQIILIPSIHTKGVEEATSIAALEGMAAGKPVVASSIGGLKELIQHEYNGILFEEKKIDDLTNHIIGLLNNREQANKLGEQAKEYVSQNHSHIQAAKKFVEMYT
ncbi:glycosyltransferase family 4 protein [Piscibacillus salipiscarius]|uniref:Glycosyltransferase family 4 protein n=1 Tax=Piscibacillus salipiscarius TaxID=299480 RepID=A0ABW5QB18_9BACI